MMHLSQVIRVVGDKFPYPVTLVNTDLQDGPLIYVNAAFTALTLYREVQVLGTNCRLLQGPLTDRQATLRIRVAIQNRVPICQDLINYKANGELFYIRLVLIPFHEGKEYFYIGLQHEIQENEFKPIDLTDRMELEDKTINPLSVLVGLLTIPNSPELENKIAETIVRLRKFVLGL